MKPPLPHALIERERYCDLCGALTFIWIGAEISGSSYKICPECAVEQQALIRASACEDMAGADASDRDCGK